MTISCCVPFFASAGMAKHTLTRPRRKAGIVVDAGVTVTSFAASPDTSTETGCAVRSQFVITSSMHAVLHCDTWLTHSPRGCGIQHGAGILQDDADIFFDIFCSWSVMDGTLVPVNDWS